VTTIDLVLIFLANYGFIALKAWQQRNVAFNKYWVVLPTSWAIALTEVYVIAKIAAFGFGLWLVFVVGTAGGLGALTAMWVHGRVFK
jgi:hypothetical protein